MQKEDEVLMKECKKTQIQMTADPRPALAMKKRKKHAEGTEEINEEQPPPPKKSGTREEPKRVLQCHAPL